MSVLIKVFGVSIVCVLTVNLLGCGCLFPFTSNSLNPYPDLYKAKALQYSGKYRAAIATYEQAGEKFLRFPVDTQIVNVSFPTFFKYYIAFCYTQLAEAEGDASLYIKAETTAKESYETAIVPSDQADALYLWACILFKQERYEEARTKFEALIDRLQQNELGPDFTVDAFLGLGKAYLQLGDNAAAQRVYAQLEQRPRPADGQPSKFLYDHYETLAALGKAYLQLGDNAAAQRVLAQLEQLIRQTGWHYVRDEVLYELGKVYLQLGDNAAAQRVFLQLLKHSPHSAHKSEVQRWLEKP